MKTTAPIQEPVAAVMRPEWIRIPKPGNTCPWCGLTRSHLYNLAAAGRIKTVSLRERGKSRGVRLVSLDSVLAYIAKLAETPEAA